jgi:hypothetical protein
LLKLVDVQPSSKPVWNRIPDSIRDQILEHESLDNLSPEDVYTGRGPTVLDRRRRIKQKTIKGRRRLYYRQKAA